MANTRRNPVSGLWTYRSLLNNSDITVDFDDLEFGRANLRLNATDDGQLTGTIGGDGWELDIQGSFQPGSPGTLWFQGKGIVGGSPWVYDYLCYVVPHIPNGIDQVPALVGSVTRAIPHPNGQGGTSPAGVVASFYAVLNPAYIPPVYIRKNAWDANNGGQFQNPDGSYTDLYWYAQAVGVMKSRPISDPTSWWFYAAIHGEYLTTNFGQGIPPAQYPNWKKIESIPQSATLDTLPSENLIQLFWDQCQHGTWYFAPWHRGYLVALEHILRDIIINELEGPSDWALPYWNYLNQANLPTTGKPYQYNIPPAFMEKFLPDKTTPNPLYVPERYGPNGDGIVYIPVGNAVDGTAANDECQWDTLYNISQDPQSKSQNIYGDFYGGAKTGFSHSNSGFGDLENNPHNFVHGFVGGNNSLPLSATLPQVTVQAKQPWQNTGIQIEPNETYVVAYYSGTWTADPKDNNGQQYKANGSPDVIVSPNQPHYPMVNVPMGALVGRINNNGTYSEPFLIGDGSVVPNTMSGQLELCINDDITGAYGAGLTDNQGFITVTLQGTPTEEYEGLMADPGLAALDPVFFLHHANIDRMWTAWNVTGQNSNPTDSNWLNGPGTTAGNEFAMPIDANGTPWYYTPSNVNTTDVQYYNSSLYSYTYDDISLTSYDNTPPPSSLQARLDALNITPLKGTTMNKGNKSELIGASNNSLTLNSGVTKADVQLDTTAWKSVSNSFAKASATALPDEIYLQLENVKGTSNNNFLSVYVNGAFVKAVSLFGIRRASMPDTSHGGSGLTFKLNITKIIDDLYLSKSFNIDALNVQIKTKNLIPSSTKITIDRISIYRVGQ